MLAFFLICMISLVVGPIGALPTPPTPPPECVQVIPASSNPPTSGCRSISSSERATLRSAAMTNLHTIVRITEGVRNNASSHPSYLTLTRVSITDSSMHACSAKAAPPP